MKLSAIKPKWIYLVGCFLIILTIGFFVYKSKIKIYNKQNQSPEVPVSDEDLGSEIIANLKTVKVEITKDKIVPEALEINRYDQVVFDNRSDSPIQIQIPGVLPGDFNINSGENLTQSFSDTGNFEIKIIIGNETITGKITVQ